MKRAKMEPTWRPGYTAKKPKRQPRLANHGDRFALLAETQAETRTLLEASRLYMVRDDFVDLLAARYEQLLRAAVAAERQDAQVSEENPLVISWDEEVEL